MIDKKEINKMFTETENPFGDAMTLHDEELTLSDETFSDDELTSDEEDEIIERCNRLDKLSEDELNSLPSADEFLKKIYEKKGWRWQ